MTKEIRVSSYTKVGWGLALDILRQVIPTRIICDLEHLGMWDSSYQQYKNDNILEQRLFVRHKRKLDNTENTYLQAQDFSIQYYTETKFIEQQNQYFLSGTYTINWYEKYKIKTLYFVLINT